MTVTLVRPAKAPGFTTAPVVRVRPAPILDPPYDDEPDRPRGTRPFGSGHPTVEPPAAPPDRGRAEAHRMVRRYLDLCLEVLGGYRPLTHLRALTEPARFDEVAAQLGRLGRSPLTRPGSGLVRMGADRPRLRHLRVCEIRDGVVEAAAVLGRGEQVRALTLRLEQKAGAWLCTHLEVL
jgi:Family of unknown function (DUF6459)